MQITLSPDVQMQRLRQRCAWEIRAHGRLLTRTITDLESFGVDAAALERRLLDQREAA